MSNTITVTSETADEFYASRLPKREETPAADEPAKADAKTEAATESTPHDKARKPIQPRINELVAARNSAQSDAEAARNEVEIERLEKEQLRNELSDLKKQFEASNAPAAPKEQSTRPSRDKFASEDEFSRALGDWEFDTRLAAHEAQKLQARVVDNWNARRAASGLEDFDAVVGAAEVIFSQGVLDEIVDSDMGVQIAYHLAKNPAEAQRIAALRPANGAREIWKLNAELARSDAPKAKPVKVEKSKAPEPLEVIKGSSNPVGKKLDDMNYDEFVAARKAGRK